MKSDIEITREFEMLTIDKVAEKAGIHNKDLILYGNYKAKVNYQESDDKQKGKLILVTAINPTKAGEGKSTTSVGLGDALSSMGKNTVIALREPSLGPVFGLKGGATGGGYAQVVPMEDINLHFTGDMHAITSANNLISACLDNHIYQGNELDFDLDQISWKRCMDMNDRVLRNVTVGQGKKVDGIERMDHFQISVASEIMAILCLASSFSDLKKRIANICLGFNTNKEPIFVSDLGVEEAASALLKDAIDPNLVQTLYGTPTLIHGGPFANIAHGCNSIIATKTALNYGNYVVTEAGFGADLGAEKFLDIKCPTGELTPSAVVIVATIRALKLHGNVAYEDLQKSNVDAMIEGCANLEKHIDTIKSFGLPYVIAINKFSQDSNEEISALLEWAKKNNHKIALSTCWEDGPKGGVELAEQVLIACEETSNYHSLYNIEDSIEEKITKVATTCYGAKDIELSEKAKEKLELYKSLGWESLRICIAKTPNSLSDDAKVVGAPKGHTLHVSDLSVSRGAGFIVVYTGSIMTMPGLPKHPAALDIKINDKKEISGLF